MMAADKLTEDQVVRALRRLDARWPDGLMLASLSGGLHLLRIREDGSQPMTPKNDWMGGGMDSEAVVATFGNIPNDGGDW